MYLFFENGIKQKDSSEILDGRFYFKGKTIMPILGRLTLGENSFIEDFYLDGNNISIDCSTQWNIYKGRNGGSDTMNMLQITLVSGSKIEKVKSDFKKWALKLMQSERLEKEKRQEYFNKLSQILHQYPENRVSPYLVSTSDFLYYNQILELSSYYDSSLNNTYEGKNVQRLLKRLDASKNYAIGESFKDFTMYDSINQSVNTRELRDKYTVVIFWASWCGPCRVEHPELNSLYEKYKHKGLGLIGVSLDTDRKKWLSAIKKDHLKWPQLSDLKGTESEIGRYYGFTNGVGIPFNLIVDKEGRIIEKDLTVDQLKEILKKLL